MSTLGIAVTWVLIMLSLSYVASKLATVVIAHSTLSPPPYGQPHLLQGLEMDVGVFAQLEGVGWGSGGVAEFQDFNGGPVAFGGSKGYITGKGKIKTGKLDFEDVCFVKELQHFNLFFVSQMCDKKNKVLFTDSECLVLSPEFKLPDENQEDWLV
ncbi:hypothetical protein Tco_0545871 [Tanacetum coccineum]